MSGRRKLRKSIESLGEEEKLARKKRKMFKKSSRITNWGGEDYDYEYNFERKIFNDDGDDDFFDEWNK